MADETETDGTDVSREHSGRSIGIDTGFYHVSVSGDPHDTLGDLLSAAEEAADRAKEDVEQMDDQLDGDDIHYR